MQSRRRRLPAGVRAHNRCHRGARMDFLRWYDDIHDVVHMDGAQAGSISAAGAATGRRRANDRCAAGSVLLSPKTAATACIRVVILHSGECAIQSASSSPQAARKAPAPQEAEVRSPSSPAASLKQHDARSPRQKSFHPAQETQCPQAPPWPASAVDAHAVCTTEQANCGD